MELSITRTIQIMLGDYSIRDIESGVRLSEPCSSLLCYVTNNRIIFVLCVMWEFQWLYPVFFQTYLWLEVIHISIWGSANRFKHRTPACRTNAHPLSYQSLHPLPLEFYKAFKTCKLIPINSSLIWTSFFFAPLIIIRKFYFSICVYIFHAVFIWKLKKRGWRNGTLSKMFTWNIHDPMIQI